MYCTWVKLINLTNTLPLCYIFFKTMAYSFFCFVSVKLTWQKCFEEGKIMRIYCTLYEIKDIFYETKMDKLKWRAEKNNISKSTVIIIQMSICLVLQARDVCNMINMCVCYLGCCFHNAKFTNKKINLKPIWKQQFSISINTMGINTSGMLLYLCWNKKKNSHTYISMQYLTCSTLFW